MERIYNCPGSWLLSLTAPEEPESEYAATGRRIHDALFSKDPSALSFEESEVYERCQQIARAAYEEWIGDVAGIDVRSYTEHRFILFVDHVPYLTGQSDVLIYDKVFKRALILDYKTGHAVLTQADANLQLRAYAVLAKNELDVSSVTVGIVQPFASNSCYTVTYDNADLYRSFEEVKEKVRAAYAPDAPRAVGGWCQYCPAKGRCPEFAGSADAALQIVPLEGLPGSLEVMDFRGVDRLVGMLKAVEILAEMVKGRARVYLEADPKSLQNAFLGKTPSVKQLNPALILERLSTFGIGAAELLDKVTQAGITRALKAAGKSDAEAKQILGELVADAPTEPGTAPLKLK